MNRNVYNVRTRPRHTLSGLRKPKASLSSPIRIIGSHGTRSLGTPAAYRHRLADHQQIGIARRLRPHLSAPQRGATCALCLPGGNGAVDQTGYSVQTPFVPTLGGGVSSYIPGLAGTGTLARPFPNGILLPSLPNVPYARAVSFPGSRTTRFPVSTCSTSVSPTISLGNPCHVAYVGTRTHKYPSQNKSARSRPPTGSSASRVPAI